VIGNIIGSGIFISPSTIIRYTDSAGLSLIIWVLGALIAFLGSLCYIELGTSIREGEAIIIFGLHFVILKLAAILHTFAM
jgi:amino acid transporter